MKTLIKNQLGDKTHSFSLACDDKTAETFCSTFLDGEYAGYKFAGTTGTDTGQSYLDVRIMIKNTLGAKTYLNFAMPTNKTENDIYSALAGKTFNSVKADYIALIGMRTVA